MTLYYTMDTCLAVHALHFRTQCVQEEIKADSQKRGIDSMGCSTCFRICTATCDTAAEKKPSRDTAFVILSGPFATIRVFKKESSTETASVGDRHVPPSGSENFGAVWQRATACDENFALRQQKIHSHRSYAR